MLINVDSKKGIKYFSATHHVNTYVICCFQTYICNVDGEGRVEIQMWNKLTESTTMTFSVSLQGLLWNQKNESFHTFPTFSKLLVDFCLNLIAVPHLNYLHLAPMDAQESPTPF